MHGLRPEGLLALRIAQDHKCYLCGDYLPNDIVIAERRSPTKLANGGLVHIDHDHRCCPRNRSCPKCRRGLTHLQCNLIVGLANEDPARLRRIADNLAAAIERAGEIERADALF